MLEFLLNALITFVLVLVFLLFCGAVFLYVLLFQDDLRHMRAKRRAAKAKEAAKQDTREKKEFEAHAAWSTTIFHKGIDRATGQEIIGHSKLPTQQAKEQWEALEDLQRDKFRNDN